MVLSQREKGLVAVPLLLACLFGFYRWVHQPLLTRRAQAQELSSKTRADLKSQQSKLTREGDLKSRLTAVTSREATLDGWVPGKNSAALLIWYLSQAEAQSGVMIRGLTVGERREVQAVPKADQSGVKTEPSSSASSPPPPAATAPPVASSSPPSPAPSTAGAATTLTVVQLDLKVDGRFAEQLLFHQELDATPLFLSTTALSLAGSDKLPIDKVTKLLQEGNGWMATQLLQASPTLNGSYQLLLYFKSVKVGPSTEPMQFSEPTGRPDPFVMDGVDEFLQTLIDHFSALPGDEKAAPDANYPWADSPFSDPSQMG